MCGIAGIWHRDGQPVSQSDLQAMADILRHRGPDGDGLWIQDSVGLAHRRLKIIDVSERAHQPMVTPDGALVLSYNGEIHNYLELRSELLGKGVVFLSDSDTEVALWAYRLWGESCFERFNGMWAMAFWDAARRELVLSRDRFGIKPLYYSIRGPRVAFASEAKAILTAFPEERRTDVRELKAFLDGEFPDQGEHTFFATVRQLAPGHNLVVRADGESRRKYWNFEPGHEEPRARAEEEFRWLLADSVKLRLRSDVPLGILLSGGLDSSAIARLAVDQVRPPLHAFSLVYDDPRVDESGYARAVMDAGGAYDIHWLKPSSAPLLETIRNVTWHHDAPCPQRGRYPAWHLLRETSRHVTVVLTGDGSDEVLGGYPRFVLPALLDRLLLSRASLRDTWREFRSLGDVVSGRQGPVRQLLMGPLISRFRLQPWRFNQVLADVFLHAGDDAAAVESSRLPPVDPPTEPYRSRLNNALWREFTWAGLPEALHAMDAICMAYGVENRSPLLDHRLVEFVFGLPFDEKIRDGWTKSLLRRSMADLLPDVVRLRKQKLGFPVPLDDWFTSPAHAPALREALLDGVCVQQGVFDRAKLEFRLARRIRAGSNYSSSVLWRWLSTEMWYRDFIARPPAGPPYVASRA